MRTLFLTILLATSAASTASGETSGYLDFKGRALVVVSDADMVATAYTDGNLGTRPDTLVDAVSIIPLGSGPLSIGAARTVPVSNAVTAWPSNLAVAPDGRWGLLTELAAPAPAGARRFDELRPGNGLALLDLSDSERPRVVERIELEATTVAAAIHPGGRLAAVTLRGAGAERRLAVFEVDGRRLGTPIYTALPGSTSDTPHIEWHPSGRFIAATFAERNEVRFFELVADGRESSPMLKPWGEPVATGLLPGVGYFTPDGRHFLVTNLYWGASVSDTYLGTQAAILMSIRFDDGSEGRKPVHEVVSSAAIGGSPENFAISPTGDLVAALNMDQSYAPRSHPRFSPYSSLTLLALDRGSGRLDPVATQKFDGVLPEGITFDASGRYIAIANFQSHNPARDPATTTIDFWEVVHSGPTPSLVQLDFRMTVPRGAHIVKLIR